MTRIQLEHIETENGSHHLDGELRDGKLIILGHDLGEAVTQFFQENEYEWWVSLSVDGTRKLFETLNIADVTDDEKLRALRDRFGILGKRSFENRLRRHCEASGIELETHSWL